VADVAVSGHVATAVGRGALAAAALGFVGSFVGFGSGADGDGAVFVLFTPALAAYAWVASHTLASQAKPPSG
jgi:anti-sigma factor RsiW